MRRIDLDIGSSGRRNTSSAQRGMANGRLELHNRVDVRVDIINELKTFALDHTAGK